MTTDPRYLETAIADLCFSGHKMAFISGPRQCGKTTMTKHLLKERGQGAYFNWDDLRFRKLWTKDPSAITNGFHDQLPLIILDEIHKAKLWKRNLKGVYDTLDIPADIIVTGSTPLNVYKKGGDSLLGRYYHFRMHPFSLAELLENRDTTPPDLLLDKIFHTPNPTTDESSLHLNNLDEFGPFPEPLFAQSQKKLNAWRLGRIERLVREDLRDLSRISELSRIEMLVSLLPDRASNALSIQSLSEDLEVAYTTIQRWMNYLEALYYHFELMPYSTRLSRTIKKETKLYLWDWSEIADDGARFENLIGAHLLKYVHHMTDAGYGKYELRYVRNKQKQEIDFLILKNNQPWLPIEVKLSQTTPSDNWRHIMPLLGCKRGLQIVKTPNINIIYPYAFGDVAIKSAAQCLNFLS